MWVIAVRLRVGKGCVLAVAAQGKAKACFVWRVVVGEGGKGEDVPGWRPSRPYRPRLGHLKIEAEAACLQMMRQQRTVIPLPKQRMFTAQGIILPKAALGKKVAVESN